MENKLLVGGSAIAVVVLVLASLSPVVGFHSVKSTSFKDSPLFSVRIKRVNNEEQDALTCDYVGRGKICNLLLPKRDTQMETIERAINMISKMDEKTFNHFILITINKLLSDNLIEHKHIERVRETLVNIRNDPNIIMKYLPYENDDSIKLYSKDVCPPLTVFQGCILFLLVLIIGLPIYGIWFFFAWYLPYIIASIRYGNC